MPEPRLVVSFSCGAASAVAAKLAVGMPREVVVIYCDTSADEHADNLRFLADVEQWIERPILRLQSPKYQTVEQVWRGEGYVAGPIGASCTRHLKRKVWQAFRQPDDVLVLGFTADETNRIENFEDRNPGVPLLWLLRDAGITKTDCYRILTASGIKLPAMYLLGHNHNNCIGCCKGGWGYWNKIRRDFLDVFVSRAKVFREIGFQIGGSSGRVWLDELHPDDGRDVPEPDIECGLFCDSYRRLVEPRQT